MTLKEIFKLSRLYLLGIPFLLFSAKLFMDDYNIDKKMQNDLFVDSGNIKTFSYKRLPALTNVTADPPTEVVFTLTNGKKYYSDKFNQILFNSNYDNDIFSTGHNSTFKVSKVEIKDGINKFVELSIDNKKLLEAEVGSDEFKKTDGKYFLLTLGLILTLGGLSATYFFRKSNG